MIVRIATEGQYEIPDDLHDELNRLDNATVDACESGSDDQFRETYGRMIALVRDRGTRLSADDLRGSEVILPPPDLSLEEARHEFTGEGILPD